jgi:hypothetical protein
MKLLTSLSDFSFTGDAPNIIQIPKPNFIRHPLNPLVTRDAGTSYWDTVQCCSLLYDNGWWYCYYDGWDFTDRWGVHLKKSQDLVNWTFVPGPWPGGTQIDTGNSLASYSTLYDGRPAQEAGSCDVFKFGTKYYMYYICTNRPIGATEGPEDYEGRIMVADSPEGPWFAPGTTDPYAWYAPLPLGGGVSYEDVQWGVYNGWEFNGSCSQITSVWFDGTQYRGVANATSYSGVFKLLLVSSPTPIGPWIWDSPDGESFGGAENSQMLIDSTNDHYFVVANGLIGLNWGYADIGVFMNSIPLWWGDTPENFISTNVTLALAPSLDFDDWDGLIIGVPSTPVFKDGKVYIAYDGRSKLPLPPTANWQRGRDIGIISADWPIPFGDAIQCVYGQELRSTRLFSGDGCLAVNCTVLEKPARVGFLIGDDSLLFEFAVGNTLANVTVNGVSEQTAVNFYGFPIPTSIRLRRGNGSVKLFSMSHEVAQITDNGQPIQVYANFSGILDSIEISSESMLGDYDPNAITPTGQAATASVGQPLAASSGNSSSGNVVLPGQQAAAYVGSPIMNGSINITPTGQSAAGDIGTVFPAGQIMAGESIYLKTGLPLTEYIAVDRIWTPVRGSLLTQ